MAPVRLLSLSLAVLALTLSSQRSAFVLAHGNHNQEPLGADADWATLHMQEEHHFNNLDVGAFFFLHDFDNDGEIEGSEIQRFYGLEDESNEDVPKAKRDEVVRKVLELFDSNHDGRISQTELRDGWSQGKRLPDFGLGPGHHGDDEFEYEIHHYEKFHDENTKDEDLIHPEDIAHFKRHEELEAIEARLKIMDAMPVVEVNIPMKYRRH